ncbi:MAG TPA: 3-keto-5-aminohexanoate cleavage protein [Streptosporangiaceae bacterium]|jgi:uncharacterized protein (DUF849 family)
MMLQVAVNGDRLKADHSAVPVTAEELARDARECLAAGAQEFHVHVRDGDGHPTLAPAYSSVNLSEEGAVEVMRALLAGEIHEILDRAGLRALRLQHGDGALTWILIEDAVRRGLDTRVGLEDTLYLPDGSRAPGNAALVRAARDLGAGQPD